MKKAMSLFLSLVMVLALLAGCGGNPSTPSNPAASTPSTGSAAPPDAPPTDNSQKLSGTLEYWTSWSEAENQALVLQKAAEAFTQLHPDVTINFTFNGRDNRNLVVSAIETGAQIDLMDSNIDNIVRLWGNNIMDLSSYMEQTYDTTNGKPYKDCIMPSMLSLASQLFDGKTMCIPHVPQAFMIFCNKNIFDEVGITEYPTSWKDFLTACEKIKAAGYIPITTDSTYCTSWIGYYLSRLIGDEGLKKLVKDKTLWSDPKVLEAAKAIEELASLGYFDPDLASNVYPAAQQDMVISENIAMYINGTWLPNEVADATSPDFTWGAFAFPEVPNGIEGTEAGCYSTFAIAVNKDADPAIADAAVAFAVYLTTSEYDQMFSDEANSIPMSLDAVWPENLADAREVMNNYTTRYASQTSITTNSDSLQIISDACLKLMTGQITAEEFVTQASNF
jgi:raffinose/stachyose/melibiose transport system substrate-binding protein